MNIGRAIKVERAKLDITQSELAEKVGVHKQTIYKWETGLGEPRHSDLLAMSRVFGPNWYTEDVVK